MKFHISPITPQYSYNLLDECVSMDDFIYTLNDYSEKNNLTQDFKIKFYSLFFSLYWDTCKEALSYLPHNFYNCIWNENTFFEEALNRNCFNLAIECIELGCSCITIFNNNKIFIKFFEHCVIFDRYDIILKAINELLTICDEEKFRTRTKNMDRLITLFQQTPILRSCFLTIENNNIVIKFPSISLSSDDSNLIDLEI